MVAKLIWKGALFALSIFMLLLTMGYGMSPVPKGPANTAEFSGQAKIAVVGARTSGFRSAGTTNDPVVEKTVWDKVRDTTSDWFSGPVSASASSSANRSELQKLQHRRTTQGKPGGLSVLKAY